MARRSSGQIKRVFAIAMRVVLLVLFLMWLTGVLLHPAGYIYWLKENIPSDFAADPFIPGQHAQHTTKYERHAQRGAVEIVAAATFLLARQKLYPAFPRTKLLFDEEYFESQRLLCPEVDFMKVCSACLSSFFVFIL
jgi:hypothetical protein